MSVALLPRSMRWLQQDALAPPPMIVESNVSSLLDVLARFPMMPVGEIALIHRVPIADMPALQRFRAAVGDAVDEAVERRSAD
ncbi:hypothetical protein [Burkholderia stabilis]|uniref:hypothetical protein n=1 Tax=Burkholderia stabilis TaxID=95485 RepID=UPI0015905325|nr:hypothetical protein [Burkholderia stabilis]